LPQAIGADNIDFGVASALRHYVGMVAAQDRFCVDHLPDDLPVGDAKEVKLSHIVPDGHTADVFRCDAICAVQHT
jgi:hypothetical protein